MTRSTRYPLLSSLYFHFHFSPTWPKDQPAKQSKPRGGTNIPPPVPNPTQSTKVSSSVVLCPGFDSATRRLGGGGRSIGAIQLFASCGFDWVWCSKLHGCSGLPNKYRPVPPVRRSASEEYATTVQGSCPLLTSSVQPPNDDGLGGRGAVLRRRRSASPAARGVVGGRSVGRSYCLHSSSRPILRVFSNVRGALLVQPGPDGTVVTCSHK